MPPEEIERDNADGIDRNAQELAMASSGVMRYINFTICPLFHESIVNNERGRFLTQNIFATLPSRNAYQ